MAKTLGKTEKFIFHIAEKSTWAEAQGKGQYAPAGWEDEGFIHFSTKHQLKATAERYYQGQTGLVLLKVDVRNLKAELKYENTSGGEEAFPHLYGPLNLDAVKEVAFIGLTKDGEFLWPDVPF